jgi:hypothetical protein
MATHPKGFALMPEDLQPRITMDSIINGFQFTIGWGQGQRPQSAGGQGQRS